MAAKFKLAYAAAHTNQSRNSPNEGTLRRWLSKMCPVMILTTLREQKMFLSDVVAFYDGR